MMVSKRQACRLNLIVARTACVVVTTALAAACVQDDGGGWSPAADREPIVGGATHSGHPGVGALVIDYGGYFDHFCSGTLIASQWVLTAAHCLDDPDIEPYMVSFFNGANVASPSGGTAWDADAFFPHPHYDGHDNSNDMGLVHLRVPASGVTPYPYGATPHTGTSVTWVGYGVNVSPDTGGGVKRIGTGTISDVYLTQYSYNFGGVMPCSGDSGGAGFINVSGTETLAGVISAGDETCTSYGVDTRTDAFRTWIEGTLAGDPGVTDCRIVGGDCGGSQACYPVDDDEFACLPSDGRASGAACNPEAADTLPCGDGSICIGTSSTNPTEGECMDFCRGDGDCGAGRECQIPIFEDLDGVGVCVEELTECRIIGGDCAADQACFPAADDATYCFPSAGIALGSTCNPDQSTWGEVLPCGDGSICLRVGGPTEGECIAFCRNDDHCPGTCRLGIFTGISDIGYCQPETACTDGDGDGHCVGPDCDDGDAGVYPGAVEICGDGIDNNCDGAVDETCGCTDADGDGVCEADDCNDGDASVGVPHPEDCGNGIDDDCDGATDGDDTDCGGTGPDPDGGPGPDPDGGGGDDEELPPGACRCTTAGSGLGSAPLLAALTLLGLALLRRRGV